MCTLLFQPPHHNLPMSQILQSYTLSSDIFTQTYYIFLKHTQKYSSTNPHNSITKPTINISSITKFIIQRIDSQKKTIAHTSTHIQMNHQETSPRIIHEPIIDRTQKILALQQQLISVRKQMSKKQSQWEKQRSNLLSKLQVNNIENMELKQRNANLIKINETLSNAMNAAELTSQNDKQETKVKKPKQLILPENCNVSGEDSQVMRKLEKCQEEIKKLNRIIGEKDFQLNNLSKMMNDFKNKAEESNNAVYGLEETCYNLKRKVEKKQEQILRLHKQIQQLEEKIELNNQYIDQTRRKSTQPQKRPVIQQQLDQSADYVKKYTKNSSYLMMKPTPDHSAFEGENSLNWNQNNLSQLGYDDQSDQEEQKLLCEVCNRVISFANFEAHVQVCGYKVKDGNTKNLFQKKKQIELRLERIRIEEQKQNKRNRYYKNQPSRFQYEDSTQNRDKIMQIRQIARDLTSNKREIKKIPYNDFSIKSNYYY